MPPQEPTTARKPSGQADIAERVHCMLLDECKLMANPLYIETVQTESMNPNFRRRITEWMLSVRSPAVAPYSYHLRFKWALLYSLKYLATRVLLLRIVWTDT
jgi:hypothetical protein